MAKQASKPEPLVIQEQGSFAVGGTVVAAPGTFDPRKPLEPAGQTYRASSLSPQCLATAVTARYTAFRDHGAQPLSLDYLPLEEFLSVYPGMVPDVADELKPGSSYCIISPAEVPEALRGTTSSYVLVRKHAVCVLGERRLGDAVGRQVIPRLRAIAETDPDSEVSRLLPYPCNGGKPTAEHRPRKPLVARLGAFNSVPQPSLCVWRRCGLWWSAKGHKRRFREVCNESALPSGPEA
jgi:hypothetical protein